ncbi:MAG: hypothetical protein KF810_17010 [Rhizobiaceae bacterium]|nr:hypothetical protein [Rhizobiaceae bacterium]
MNTTRRGQELGPGPLKVANRTHTRQFSIQSDVHRRKGEWDDIYVDFSGYFGSYGPDMFAAAPDMFEALKETLAIATRNEDGPWADRARAALRKASEG